MNRRSFLALPPLLALTLRAQAGKLPIAPPKGADILPLLMGGTSDALAGSIRGYLVRSMPAPLYETRKDWGRTSPTANGVKWKGIKPEIMRSPKNDGTWRHLVVVADRPADTLVFDIRNLSQPEPGRITFIVFFALDARILYEQQNWENGVRLYSGSAQARFRARATLHCEIKYRLEAGSFLLPEAVVRLRVTRADVNYENFAMEHMAGLGGEAARVLGDAIHGGLDQWHPSLQRDLLAKANAAIEKSADTKEVRLSLQELVKKKGWLKAPAPKPAARPTPVRIEPLAPPSEPVAQPTSPRER